MGETYKKSKGNAGLDGIQFQVNLVTVFLLNALRKLQGGWRISTENTEAAKFDDIVVELPDGTAIFVQAKTKGYRKITKEQLLSTNSKNIDFSLPKYFFSYCEIKTKFKPNTVMVCTNTALDGKGLENISTIQYASDESFLCYKDAQYLIVKFNGNILSELRQKAEIYCKYVQDKGFNKEFITDDNLKDFLDKFQVICNFPKGDKLDKVIDQQLSGFSNSSLMSSISHHDIYKKLEDWFREDCGEYLTEARAKVMFCEIKSDKYCAILNDYNIFFGCEGLDFSNTRRIYHLATQKGNLIETLWIYRVLQNMDKKSMFVNPDYDVIVQKNTVLAFGISKHEFLVLIIPENTSQVLKSTIKDNMKDILDKYNYKKVILICKRQIAQEIDLEYDIYNVERLVTFLSFSKESQERLIRKDNIVFQGEYINLKQLLHTSRMEDYADAISSDILEKLVKEEKVEVGSRISGIDEEMSSYYIHRNFEREISENGDDDTSLLSRKEIFTEETILKVREKVVLISDTAGMGKTTVLTKLSVDLKECKKHLWVIKIELNEYTKILRDFLRKKKETISIVELINSNNASKLKNHLEKFTFSMDGKVVVMLDGFDEISPNYTALILSLIIQCQKADNFAKVIITTRPHMSQDLEKELQVKPFLLQPFTKQNQIDFLTNYWTHNLYLNDTTSEKCKKYAHTLLNKMSSWISKENNFAVIPLQVRMLAEIFQENINGSDSTDWEGCEEFINGDETEPALPEKMDINKLYEMFTEKKLDDFMYKANPTGSVTSNYFLTIHQELYFLNHQSLAIEMVIDEQNLTDLFSRYQYNDAMELDMLKIGIVQMLNGNLDFIHRSFAEYFVAKSIFEISELQHYRINQNVIFQGFLIDEVLCNPQFTVIRAFLDSSLANVVNILPPNSLENYKRCPYSGSKPWEYRSELIHILAGEGCLAILQLILKCIDFKIIDHEEIDIWDLCNKNAQDQTDKNIKSVNTLDILQSLVNQGGMNIKEEKGSTPLLFAAEGGHLEMIKFLVKQGANVDSRNKEGIAAIHVAAYNGHLDSVTFLTQCGAKINVKNNKGTTPLHSAAQGGHLVTVKYLVKEKAVFCGNNNGSTPLHLAAQDGHIDTVKFLAEISDVNIKNNKGIVALHLAAANNHLDTIKFLVERGADIHAADTDGFTPLHAAVQSGHFEILKFLVKQGADVNRKNNKGTTPLISATAVGHLGMIEFLVEHGADICNGNNFGFTPLHVAAQNGDLEIVRFLMQQCSSTTKSNTGTTPLHLAAQYGHLSIVKYFADHSADLNITNINGFTSLHLSVQGNHLHIAKLLVQQGADVNVRSIDDTTPLLLAAGYGDLIFVKFLVKHNANMNIANIDDDTALHLASKGGHLHTVKYLMKEGLNIHIKNKTGETSLHLATLNGHFNIIEYLVQNGIDTNARNSTGFTSLHLAIIMDFLDAIKFLIQHSSVNIKNRDGITPLHLAAQSGFSNVMKLLLENGADVNSTNNYGNTALHAAVQADDIRTVTLLVEHSVKVNLKNIYGLTAFHLAVCGSLDIVKYFIKQGLDVNDRDEEGRVASIKQNRDLEEGFGVAPSNGQTPMHIAASQGDLDTVQFFVEKCIYLNSTDTEGRTPLHIAARCNRTFCVKFLVICGAEFNIKDNHGCVPLHYIAQNGNLDCIKFLIERDADTNIENKSGQTPLHFAARWGNFECVKFLVESGSSVAVKDFEGRTLLHLAARWGDLLSIRYLVQLDINVNVKDNAGITPLHLASRWSTLDCVKPLVENGAGIDIKNNEGRSALHSAVRWGDIQVVKFLLMCDTDANLKDKYGYTPLHTAAQWGDVECVQFLVERGVDVNVITKDGFTPLHAAASWCDLDCIKFFVERGVDVMVKDSKGRTPLHLATLWGDLDCVKYFVESGSDVNAKDKDGRVPLYHAAQKGNLDCIKHYIECKVDINVGDSKGRTPLHSAVLCGDVECIRFLTEQGIDINVRDNKGYTPLHLAVWCGRLNCVKFLLENKADVNAENSFGRTVLHVAAKWGRLHCAKLLLERGAVFDIVDDGGNTPLALASRNGHSAVVSYLEEWKTDI